MRHGPAILAICVVAVVGLAFLLVAGRARGCAPADSAALAAAGTAAARGRRDAYGSGAAASPRAGTEDASLEIQVGGVLPGEADAAGPLHAFRVAVAR